MVDPGEERPEGGRIVPGGELALGGLADVVAAAPAAAALSGTPRPAGTLPPTDMTYLDGRLMAFLSRAGSPSCDDYGQITITDTLASDPIKAMVQKLGSSFFTLSALQFDPYGGRKVLKGSLNLSPSIPLSVLKAGIASIFDSGYVDYFLQEFGGRFGITDETKPLDLTEPGIAKYLPGITELSSLTGRYTIPPDPYLFLLTLEVEERKVITFFFEEARKIKPELFPKFNYAPFTGGTSAGITNYAAHNFFLQELTTESGIIPFTTLLEIGKKHDIRGLAQYADRLEQFVEKLKNISASTPP